MFTRRTSRREEIFEHHVTEFHGGRKALSVQHLVVPSGWIRGAVDKQGSVDLTWEGRAGGVGGTSSGAAPGDSLSGRVTLPPQVLSPGE